MTVVLGGVGVAAVLAAISTVLLAAGTPPAQPACVPPRLPGAVVDVTLAGGPPMPMGHLRVWPRRVPAGTVTIRAVSAGPGTHEVVVLPLPRGHIPGERPVGPDGTVDEIGLLGEASNSCHAGTGAGLRPGSSGWVTLTLPPGRYELVCNVPGHYAAGMYAELGVR
jgi:hypothetical protein